MTAAQVVETSVTVNNNNPIQDYVHPDDQTQPTFEMTPGFKPFTIVICSVFYENCRVESAEARKIKQLVFHTHATALSV